MQSRVPRGCYLAASWGLPWQVSGESGAGPGVEPTHCMWVMGILTTSLLPDQLHFKMRLIYLESRKRESEQSSICWFTCQVPVTAMQPIDWG